MNGLERRRHLSVAVVAIVQVEHRAGDQGAQEKLGEYGPIYVPRVGRVGVTPCATNKKIQGGRKKNDADAEKSERETLYEERSDEKNQTERKNDSREEVEFAKVNERCRIFEIHNSAYSTALPP